MEKVRMKKKGIRTWIFAGLLLFVIIPFVILMLITYHVFNNYEVDNFYKSMQDTIHLEAVQIDSMAKRYEEATMTLYYDGMVDSLDVDVDAEAINNSLTSVAYAYSGIVASYLAVGDQVYYCGIKSNEQNIKEMFSGDISDASGHAIWYATNQTFPQYGGNYKYILARTLNSKKKKNIATLYLVVDGSLVSDALDS